MRPDAAVAHALRRLGVEHEMIEIDPQFADTAAFCARYGYPLERSANTIIVASKKEPRKFCACVVLATTRLDVNGRVRKLLGVPKASFATVDQMKDLTGMELGGVTPFALPAGLPVYVDARVMALDWIVLGGGGRSTKVTCATTVFGALGAEIVSDLALSGGTPEAPAR